MYVASTAPSSPVHRRRPVEGPRPRMHAEVRAGTMHDRPRTEARTRTMTETRTGGGTKTWARTTKARAARTRSHTRTSVGPRKRSPRKRCANNACNHQFFGHFLHFYLLFLLFPLGTVPPLCTKQPFREGPGFRARDLADWSPHALPKCEKTRLPRVSRGLAPTVQGLSSQSSGVIGLKAFRQIIDPYRRRFIAWMEAVREERKRKFGVDVAEQHGAPIGNLRVERV